MGTFHPPDYCCETLLGAPAASSLNAIRRLRGKPCTTVMPSFTRSQVSFMTCNTMIRMVKIKLTGTWGLRGGLYGSFPKQGDPNILVYGGCLGVILG